MSLVLLVASGLGYRTSPVDHPLADKAAPTIPNGRFFDYVVVIILERKGLNEINATSAPYLTQLASRNGLAVSYTSLSSVTVSNYLALTGGSTFNLASSPTPSTYSLTVANIADRIEAAGLTWKAYMESMPQPCYATNNSKYQNYTVRHNPFVYFTDITNNTARCNSHIVPGNSTSTVPSYWNLVSDLGSTATASNFMWLTPNLCNDMSASTCGVRAGDYYLSILVPQILNSTLFKTQRTALLITFGQGNGAASYPTAYVYAVWAGLAAKQQFKSSTFYTHYSFLATLEYNWGLSSLGLNDTRAPTMTEFFTATTTGGLSAAFDHTPTTTIANQPVTFTASVTGGTAPYGYLWSFGDGSPPSTTNPGPHTYASAGRFTVTLGVTDASLKTATITNTLIVTASLAADFNFSPTNPAVGDTITFMATQTGGTSPFTYNWSFGDGSPPATGGTASHTYAVEGAFVVALTVTDSTTPTSQTGTVSHSIVVNPQPLKASFTMSPNPLVGTPATFTATVSGGISPYSYAWAFGDTGLGVTNPASHTYTTAGTLTVTLTVTDSNAAVTTFYQSIIVAPIPLVATFSVSANPRVASPITFTANSTGGATPYSYAWKFGDGSSGFGQTANHTYTSAGSYAAVLTVQDSSATPQSTNTSMTIIVSPDFIVNLSPATLSFTAGQSDTSSIRLTSLGFTGRINLTVTVPLSARGLTASLGVNWASLTLGATDNLLLTIASAASTQAATYTVTVTGNGGGVPSRSASITVTVRTDLAISSGPMSGIAFPPGSSTTLTISVSSLGFGGLVFLAVSPVNGLTTSIDTNPVYLTLGGKASLALLVNAATSTPPGRYRITVTATSGVIEESTTQIVAVVPALDTPFFTVTPTSPLQGETISLNGSAAGGVPPYNYTWSFGDGTSAAGHTVTHFYPAGGNFIVTLTVTDLNGERSQASTRLRVTNPPDLTALSSFASVAAPVVTLGASVLVMFSILILLPRRKKSHKDDSVQPAWQE